MTMIVFCGSEASVSKSALQSFPIFLKVSLIRIVIDWFWDPIFHTDWDVRDVDKLSPGTFKSKTERSQSMLQTGEHFWSKLLTQAYHLVDPTFKISLFKSSCLDNRVIKKSLRFPSNVSIFKQSIAHPLPQQKGASSRTPCYIFIQYRFRRWGEALVPKLPRAHPTRNIDQLIFDILLS